MDSWFEMVGLGGCGCGWKMGLGMSGLRMMAKLERARLAVGGKGF